MLFKIDDKPQEQEELSAIEFNAEIFLLNDAIENDLQKSIGILQPEASYHYTSANTWSLHELMIYCINQAHPCTLTFTAFSIKEQAARAISSLYHAGMITEINCLIDTSAIKHCEAAIQILKPICKELKYDEVHAKCIVIMGNELQATIVGSQNFTRNKRIEMGVISTNKEVAQHRKKTILQFIKDGHD
jgi:hypothetical protein